MVSDPTVIYAGDFVRVRRVPVIGDCAVDWAWNVEGRLGRTYLRYQPGDRHRAIGAAEIIDRHRGQYLAARRELRTGGLLP